LSAPEELRIGLVMNGGVSLAVWIGGVTYEVGRLVANAGNTAFSEICKLTGMTPRVDVIAGSSAGGINGAYLAMAMAYHQGNDLQRSLGALRSLWVGKGSFAALLRSPFDGDAPSLLDGDGYFLPELRDAFDGLRAPAPVPREAVPIELIMTTTLLEPARRTQADDFGARIADVDHRARLHFSRRRTDGTDDFADELIAKRLALAARCTSSFPAAFEPSYCPVTKDAATGERPDMAGIASFKQTGFVIDGGVLDNQPLDLALTEIFRQRAIGPVRRVLVYVVPDPAGNASVASGAPAPATPPPSPDLLSVVLASLVSIPSVQSIGTQIDALRQHNQKVRERRYARVLLTSYNAPEQIDDLANTLFRAYRAIRVETAVEYILGRIELGLLRGGHAGLGQTGRRDWLHAQISQRVDDLPWIPPLPPSLSPTAAAPTAATWRWGTRPVEHAVRVLHDILGRAQRLDRLVPGGDPRFLEDAWTQAFDLLEQIDRLREIGNDHWTAQADAVRLWLGEGHGKTQPPVGAAQWLNEAIIGWSGPAGGDASADALAARYATAIAAVLIGIRPSIISLLQRCAAAPDARRDRPMTELARLYGYFLRAPEVATIGLVVGRLLAFEVAQEALGGRGTLREEEIDFIQISAEGAASFGGPRLPADKLAGVQLAHFGAFYRRSWRANDWMWGRLDGVRRLVRILLDPERLRLIAQADDAGSRAGWMADRIETIALGPAGERREVLQQQREVLQQLFDRGQLLSELGYLDHPNDVVPEYLEIAVGAIARRLELEILLEELPQIATAIKADQDEGARVSESVENFRLSICALQGRPIPAARVGALLADCTLGKERIEDDVGTDRLTTLGSQTAAVAIAASSRQSGWLASVGKLVALLRAPSLLFYLFARNASAGSGSGLAFNVAVFVAGATVLASAGFAGADYGNWLMLAAVTAFLVGGLFVVVRVPRWLRVLIVLGALALGIVALRRWAQALPQASTGVWAGVAILEFLVLLGIVIWPLLTMRVRSRRTVRPARAAPRR
jgi:patatin-related protein